MTKSWMMNKFGSFVTGIQVPLTSRSQAFVQPLDPALLHPPQARIVESSRTVIPPAAHAAVMGEPFVVFFVLMSTIFTDLSVQFFEEKYCIFLP